MKEDNDLKIGWMFKVVLQPIQSEYVNLETREILGQINDI